MSTLLKCVNIKEEFVLTVMTAEPEERKQRCKRRERQKVMPVRKAISLQRGQGELLNNICACVLQVVLLAVLCVCMMDGCLAARSVCVCDLSLKDSRDCMPLLTGHTVNYSTTPSG